MQSRCLTYQIPNQCGNHCPSGGYPVHRVVMEHVMPHNSFSLSRLIIITFILSLLSPVAPTMAAVQQADAETAAKVAVELSVLEASWDFNSLYDRIHPDAHAVVPRAAVIGWFQNEFAPRGPGVSTVTGVRFVSWTWSVTGQTYPYTAEVSFQQPFADGTVVDDVVRLVQDDKGEWRWFFGRSREFVDEQITRYVPQTPMPRRGQSMIDVAAEDLNTFWAISFNAAGAVYMPPNLVASDTGYSACGSYSNDDGPAFYCGLDETIYVLPGWFDYINSTIGDFAWVTIMAHEWGHHIQSITGAYAGPGNLFELQADCLAGSYARDAQTRGMLDHGDITEALAMSSIGGDTPGLPQDQPGAHGTSDDRVTAFMLGFLDGFIGCGFTSAGTTSTASTPERATSPDLNSFLPAEDVSRYT